MKWEKIINALGKIKCKLKSSCCKSSCVLNEENNIEE